MHAASSDNLLAGLDETGRQAVTEQAKVCYMNVDRTLATWTRTALSLVMFGTIVDRYGVLVTAPRMHPGTPLAPDPLYSVGGVTLVVLGTLIALVCLLRHQAYRRTWQQTFAGSSGKFEPWLAFVFATGAVATGVVLTIILLLYRR